MLTVGFSGPTYNASQVPEDFQEKYIVRGYRPPRCSFKQCVLSLFDPTNETFNVWTHFIPPWYYLYVLYDLSFSMDFIGDPYSWPMLCYMISICIMPLASATAHSFNVMSEKARHVCFFVDYSAISLFSLGAAVAYRAYLFPKLLLNTWYSDNYVSIAFFNAIICTIVACYTRFMKQSFFQHILRLLSFAGPYWFVTFPLYTRVVLSLWDDCHPDIPSYIYYHIFFTTTAVALYISRVPERWHPGTFDIIGQSHQIFHVATMFGMLYQLHALRLKTGDIHDWIYDSAWSSIGRTVGICVINAVIVFIFSLFTSRITSKKARNGYEDANNNNNNRHED